MGKEFGVDEDLGEPAESRVRDAMAEVREREERRRRYHKGHGLKDEPTQWGI